MTHERKNDKLYFIKIKNICSAIDPVKGMKRKATDWEKIFGKHISDRGYLLNLYIHKRNLKTNSKKTIQLRNGQNI